MLDIKVRCQKCDEVYSLTFNQFVECLENFHTDYSVVELEPPVQSLCFTFKFTCSNCGFVISEGE